MTETLLEVKNLKTYFHTEDGIIPAVDGVSFQLKKGETLGIVGESGSGKSIMSLSILQLIPKPHGKIEGGEIRFRGQDLLELEDKEIRKIRGNDISMIFQEPMTSLNPVYTVGDQIMEVLRLHQGLSKKAALKASIEMLKLVGISLPDQRVHNYPHQLSGGMRQRVMIAMALACNPHLLIADEPTTALDVTTQAQILELMKNLKERLNTSILLITHDLGVVAEACDQVAVMYMGKIVEYSDVYSLFEKPKHPYTIGLLNSIPMIEDNRLRLEPIRGYVPNALDDLKGCRFCTRCNEVRDLCYLEEPPLLHLEDQKVRCWKYTERWENAKETDGRSII